MNKTIALILLLICWLLLLVSYNNLKADRDRIKANQVILTEQYEASLAETQKYKVSDSLNAVTVNALRLTLDEYKKHYTEDYKAIKKLQHSKSELQTVINTQAQTITRLQTNIIHDTLHIQPDSLKCFSYKSTWLNAEGCLDLTSNTVDLQINNRESLKIAETVTYKRFLGFLWKTNKVKSRQIDVLSDNPYTEIVNVSYINIAN